MATTGATEYFDATTAAQFIIQTWSKKAIKAREEKLVFAINSNRVYENDADLGATINIPNRSHLTAQSKDRSNNAAITFETVTDTNSTISLTTWEYSAIALETATKRQTNHDVLAFYAPEQGYALALSVDTTLAALVDNTSTGIGDQTVGTLLADLTYDDLLRSRQYLDDANAPQEDRWIGVSPAAETSLMKLDEIVHRDYDVLHGDPQYKALNKAYLGTFMGMPIYKSTNIEGTNAAGHDNVMAQRECIALVMQMQATTHVDFDINYLAKKVVVEHLYGSAALRITHGVWMAGK